LAVKIRLARAGAKKAPFYRVVAADSRAARDGRFIEILGRYNPRTEPSTVELDLAKVDAWVAKGATPTEAAGKLIAIVRGEKAVVAAEVKPSKKATAKVEADKTAAAEAKKAAAEAKASGDAAAQEVATAEEAPVEEAVDGASGSKEAPPEEPAPADASAEEAPETAETTETDAE
jgi:small subunit ribosomal protein S16